MRARRFVAWPTLSVRLVARALRVPVRASGVVFPAGGRWRAFDAAGGWEVRVPGGQVRLLTGALPWLLGEASAGRSV
ncbi:hypothetical protein ADL01_35360 [Streptomyces sp. NRRL WC-3618]|nr:hypothetical protein ADL01_35360 [Streptomyces sp. NRRL WC-3618]